MRTLKFGFILEITLLLLFINTSNRGQDHYKCGTFSSANLVQLHDVCSRPDIYYKTDDIQKYYTEHFVIYYVLHSTDSTTTDYAENLALFFEYNWDMQCNILGWQSPPQDDCGVDTRYDIYIMDTYDSTKPPESAGYFGETIRDDLESGKSYIIMDNNLTIEQLKVTVAHEFNHAIQFAYVGYEFQSNNSWVFETTSTWIEDIIYDDINDWINTFLFEELVHNPFTHPEYSITTTNDYYLYGNALFFHLLSESKDNILIKKIWQRSASVGGSAVANIDYVLNNYYGSNLNEALKEYAVWRYFTGSRDDGNHFKDAALYPELSIQETYTNLPVNNTRYPSAPGGTSYISFQVNEPGIDISFDGYGSANDYQWNAQTLSRRLNGDTDLGEIVLDNNNIGTALSSLNGISEIILTGTVTKNYETQNNLAMNYSATVPDLSVVSFWNEYGDINLGGNLKIDMTTVESGDSLSLINAYNYNVLTLNERFTGTNNYKHNNWNQDFSKHLLEKEFNPTESPSQRAKFFPLNYASIHINIDGSEIELGEIKFNDPWYLKSDGTQSGMNDFIEFDAPYEPTGKEGETNGGVFLDQDPDITPTYYSVSISPTQTINYNNSSHKIYFNNWSHNGKANFQNAELATTPLVFTDGGAEVYANHKGSLLSNTQYAFNGPSQRKIARTSDGYYHLVYESMGRVWYESKPL